jgi:hypothetical protein
LLDPNSEAVCLSVAKHGMGMEPEIENLLAWLCGNKIQGDDRSGPLKLWI